ncbi:MAG: AAA family ATPase [Deltaproteobacteria bacterium]|nr:MAG: AAA family ATPase [Deltaproteobacteria bacterium]
MHRGLVERAIADLERAAELGRELGMPLVRYTTRLSLADIHRRIGDAAGALYHAGEARLVETAGSAAGSRQSAAILLLQIHGMRGEVGAARELLAAIRPGELHEDEVAILRAMLQLRRVIARVATGALSVLLLGETGVGKEVLAELVHSSSPRSHRPFLRLNCAAMTETLLESELFGHEKGAFTGAIASKPGLLETACGGTVFLDEIGELSPAIQVKLLRVLEDRMVNPVGGLKPRPIDVRFVAATNRDLENEIARGRFRQDLYYRLAGITLVIPPLRERVGEIVPLARVFLAAACPDPRRIPAIDSAAIDLLTSHAWPGNIRELRNVVERAALLASDGAIGVEHLPDALRAPRRAARDPAAAPPAIADEPGGDREQPARSATCALEALYPGGPERERIISTLELCRGNQTRAAQVLGMSRRTLLYRLERYGLPRPRKGS